MLALAGATMMASAGAYGPGSGVDGTGVEGPGHCRILLTNDDGIDAPGLAAAYESLSTLCETIVAAPATNQSGASHSVLNKDGRVRVRKALVAGVPANAVEGSPAEAVAVGLLGIGAGKSFDLVVSGINHGENLGLGNLYSGTVNAAMEGALRGVPAIAVSQAMSNKNYARSAQLTRAIAGRLLSGKLPASVVLNINVPYGELRGICLTASGGLTVAASFEPTVHDEETIVYKLRLEPAERNAAAGDIAAYNSGCATITPLALDRTANEALASLAISIDAGSIALPNR